MATGDDSVQSFISKQLHSLLFFEEFVFSRNKFSPPSSSELEFADAVVMLGEVLFIFQIKERSTSPSGNADTERRWFQSKVLRDATKQIRDTLSYLQTFSEIRVPNERGHVFDLAAQKFADIAKIVVYMPSPALPADCRRVLHHVSRSAGFIHIVNAEDYLEIGRTLRVPEEVVRYFTYRQMVLTQFGAASGDLPEAAIVGHFVGGDPNIPPTLESVRHLHRLINDAEEWDLAPFMRRLYDHLSVPGISDDYYAILIKLAKLPRSSWRKIKERIRLCIEKVQKDTFVKPYRMTDIHTGCGFVFIPVHSEISSSADWQSVKVHGLANFTRAHKYDQRLAKCIGVMVSKDGAYFDISWCFIAHEWAEDAEIQEALARNFPFRPVKLAEVHGYRLMDE
jgi:hypothetical protein